MNVKAVDKQAARRFLKLIYHLILLFWSDCDFPSIRPLPCTNKVTGEVGTCMYNWSCHHVFKGSHVGNCIDRFLVGTCCKIPSVGANRTATTTQWLEKLSHQVTKRPQLETLATVIEILTLADKHFIRKPVSPVYHKVTVEPFAPVPAKSPLVRNGTAYSNSKSSHVSGTHLVEVIPLKKFHPPAYLSTQPPSKVSVSFTDSSTSSFLRRPTPSPQENSSSIALKFNESDGPSISVNYVEKLTMSVESTRGTEPVYSASSITPSALPSSRSNDSFLDNHDITQICGRSRVSPMGRIVGGKQSQYLKWPWMISLRRLEGRTYRHKCGAALLNRNWAITAAHCVDGKLPHEILLRLGEYNFHQVNESFPHVERRIYVVAVHPGFDAVTYENDVALLRFYDPINYGASILPVCLPQENDDAPGRIAVVTGWGRLSEEGELPGLLHEVHMPILTNAECEDMYSDAGYVESIPDVFVCAGLSDGGLDACEGDSGGPMMVRGKSGAWTLVGLISWGMGCAAPNQPGVYTRITKFINWVKEVARL